MLGWFKVPISHVTPKLPPSSLSISLTSAAMQGLRHAACLQLLGPIESFQPS